ncbi:lys9 [Symbiodinium sp. KB8]|nr:lys9 [Symbiodinium sp. KB8]
MVTAPLVDYLLRRPENHVTVASVFLHEAEKLAKGRPRTLPLELNISEDYETLSKTVSQHDLVISMVPAVLHAPAVRAAIQHGKNVVTASYTSDEIAALDEAAKKSGITVLMEAGLDPGIDHMSACKLIDGIHDRGGKVLSFSSMCGGLPAPEAANNPLGYKFSWSPRGVLTAARNAAKFLQDGKTVDVPGEKLLLAAKPYRLNAAFSLEVLPNRNSLPYSDKYRIPEVQTMMRGTLRYQVTFNCSSFQIQ